MRGAGSGSRNADHQVFTIAFFDASYLTKVRDVTVGALPDMVTFTPSGDRVLVVPRRRAGELLRRSDPSADVALAVLVDQQFGQCGTSARTA